MAEQAAKQAAGVEGMWAVKWEHCSPELLSLNKISCAATPRRECRCPGGGSHDHAITDWQAIEVTKPQITEKPLGEGEYRFTTRGLGLNWLPCFICGHKPEAAQTDMAAFVASREAGMDVTKLFHDRGGWAKLDYREHEPNWVQVKLGACPAHEPSLKLLSELTYHQGRRINATLVAYVWPGVNHG